MLVRPGSVTIEFKALEQAADEARTTPLRLPAGDRAIGSPFRWHVESFLAQHFPRALAFRTRFRLPDWRTNCRSRAWRRSRSTTARPPRSTTRFRSPRPATTA